MGSLSCRILDASTFQAWADLVERHGGVWGGCWCMGFHTECERKWTNLEEKKEIKKQLVAEGRSTAAVIFDGDQAVGWCQFGRSSEISPKSKFKRKYQSGLTEVPDWRITCFFVDRKMRGKGISEMALAGALQAIQEQGGGLVEAYPENVEGRKLSGAFICLGTIPMFERHGFVRLRQVAMHHWVMTKRV